MSRLAIIGSSNFVLQLHVEDVVLVILAALVNCVGQAAELTRPLLVDKVVNFFDSCFVGLVGLDPAPLVPHDVLVGELADGLDLLHGRVLQDLLPHARVELRVQLYLFQCVDAAVELVLDLVHGATAARPEFF